MAQQTVNLVAAGYTATQLDSGSLQVAFGGEVALLNGSVSAQISILFLDGGGNAIGNAVVVPAGTSVGSLDAGLQHGLRAGRRAFGRICV